MGLLPDDQSRAPAGCSTQGGFAGPGDRTCSSTILNLAEQEKAAYYFWGEGHLWSDRFFSTPLDEKHLWSCVRYIERNPLRAKMVKRAEEYAWSSAPAHALGREDGLLSETRPFPGPISDWSQWLSVVQESEEVEQIRRCTQTGRPRGSKSFVERVSELTGRILWPRKAGRKPTREQEQPGQSDLFEE